jgi:hypothetical protein
MRSHRAASVGLAALVAAVSCPIAFGHADSPSSPAPRRSREITDTVSTAVNPPGLQNALRVDWSRPLTASHRPLLADAHVAFGLDDLIAPSYRPVGAWAEYSPLSLFAVRAGVEPAAYFGTYGSLAVFERYARPTFEVRAGPVAAFVEGQLERWQSNAGGPLVYEPGRDTLIRTSGDALAAESIAGLLEHHVADGTWSGSSTTRWPTATPPSPASSAPA